MPVEPWLPPAAEGAVENAIRKIVDRWQATWFAGSSKVGVAGQTVNALRSSTWFQLDDAFVGQMRDTSISVGLKVCDNQGHPHNPRDSAVLAEVGREAIDDLFDSLGLRPGQIKAKFEEIVARKGLSGYAIACLGKSWSLSLVVGRSAQVGIRKLAARSGNAPELGSFENALGSETCSVSAHLGRSRLNSGEVAALGIGDVVVFDRKIVDAAPLEVSGRYPVNGRVRIAKQGKSLDLTLTSKISDEASETAPL